MQSKLTLRLDDQLIAKAKEQAKTQGTSVSVLVAQYFSLLGHSTEDSELSPTVLKLKGLLRGADTSLEDYRQHLEEKHKNHLR